MMLISSCSLIKKKVEYVSLDSHPRGLKVYKTDGKSKKTKLIGTTPMFDEDFKEDKSTYKIEYNQQGSSKISPPMRKLENCGVVWNDPILKNIPLLKDAMPDDDTLLSKINPLKLIKGGKLDCSIKIDFKPKGKVKPGNYDDCGTYLIIPPQHKFKKVSDTLINEWINKDFKPNKKSCDKLLSPKKSEELLTFLGFHHLNNSDYGIQYLMYGKLAQLGYKLDATHLVFLHHEKKGDVFHVSPEIYDIYSLRRTKKKLERIVKKEIKVEDEKTFFDHLENAVQLFPNSVALKFTFLERLHLDPASEEKNYPTIKKRINFPPSIRLTNVYYPLQKIGINYRFTPSITITDWDDVYDVNFYIVAMAFKLYAHTPIGTFTGRLGAGYSYVVAENITTGFNKKEFTPITQWGVEYYYFLNERYYVNLGYRRNQIGSEVINDGNFNLREFSSYFFSVGYYTPELQLKIKNWFN